MNQMVGEVLDLKWNNHYNFKTDTLHSNWIGGFYANCSMALSALVQLSNRGVSPARILMDEEWDCVISRRDKGNIDLYPLLFQEDQTVKIPMGEGIPAFDNHGRYGWLVPERYMPILRRWFKPPEESLKLRESIVKKNGIDLCKTIAVIYRGTDKSREVVVAPPEEYIGLAEKLLNKNPGHRVLIQTDQTQVRDQFLNHFGEACFFLPELPTTASVTPIHSLPIDELGMDKLNYSLVLQAVMLILSQCNLVVNHTGNMALWIILYRGSSNNTFQFDRNGVCVNSRGREVHARSLAEFLRKTRDFFLQNSHNSQINKGIFA